MPHPLDEFPIHQAPLSMAHMATSDRNAYDRCYFNAHGRAGDPFLITGLVFVITVLSGLSTKYSAVSSISSQQINHSIGVVFFGTFFAAVISLVVCNVIGAMKAKERRDNWPVKPQATPEIY